MAYLHRGDGQSTLLAPFSRLLAALLTRFPVCERALRSFSTRSVRGRLLVADNERASCTSSLVNVYFYICAVIRRGFHRSRIEKQKDFPK